MKPIKIIIADWLFDKYSNDMGNWFDYIQQDQEQVYNDILATLENGTIADKIQLLKGVI